MEEQDILEIISAARSGNLTRLDLSNRDIETLPAEIGTLESLEFLDLSYNSIETLPVEIGNLRNLKVLLLVKNRINYIPDEIGNLVHLRLLDLSYNFFTALPDTLGQLTELRSFDASYGRLEKIPYEFVGLPNLRELYIEENPLTFPSKYNVEKGLLQAMHMPAPGRATSGSARVAVSVDGLPADYQALFVKHIEHFSRQAVSMGGEALHFDITFDNDTERP